MDPALWAYLRPRKVVRFPRQWLPLKYQVLYRWRARYRDRLRRR